MSARELPSDVDANHVAELLAWLDHYCKRRLNLQLMDERRTFSPHLVLDFGRAGLMGLQVPGVYGGRPVSIRGLMRIMSKLGAIDATLGLFVGLTNVLGAGIIARAGAPALRERVLPDLATGRMLAAFALTEPHAGSHPGSLRTTAIPSSDGWSLSGVKWLSGLAAWSGVINTFARITPCEGGAGPISAFCIPTDRAGIAQGPEALTIGMRSMIQNEVRFEGVHVDANDLLGAEGQGMLVAHEGMGLGRLVIAGAAVGLMGHCLAVAHQYATRRRIATGLLAAHPYCSHILWELAGSALALEKLVTLVAGALDAGRDVPLEILAVCKIIGGEESFRCANSTLQILGGRGYLETEAIARPFRDSRVLRIFEGPTEALLHHVGLSAASADTRPWIFVSQELQGGDLVGRAQQRIQDLRALPSPESKRKSARLAHTFLSGQLLVITAQLAAGRLAADTLSPTALRTLEAKFTALISDVGRHYCELLDSEEAHSDDLGRIIERLGSWTSTPLPYEEGRVSQLLTGVGEEFAVTRDNRMIL